MSGKIENVTQKYCKYYDLLIYAIKSTLLHILKWFKLFNDDNCPLHIHHAFYFWTEAAPIYYFKIKSLKLIYVQWHFPSADVKE